MLFSYSFDKTAKLGLVTVLLYLAAAIVLSFVIFRQQMKKDN